jgi:hypothetical protein
MKQKIALIAGCSHAAGAEIDGTDESKYNREHSFGSVLANLMEYTPVNIASSGAANTGIARSVLRWFSEFYKSEEMEVFVCVGWTESSRLEVPANFPLENPVLCYYNNQNLSSDWYDPSFNYFHRINFGWKGYTDLEKQIIPPYQQFMAENQLLLENWAAQTVLMLEYFLKSKQIKYVMCNTMHMFRDSDFTNFTVNLIDERYYYKLRSSHDEAFYWKYRNLGYSNPKAKYWHHTEEPHRLFAEELYKFIGEIYV